MAAFFQNSSYSDRHELIKMRMSHGYPLHSPPHPYRDEGYYMISAANYDKKPVLVTEDRRTEFENELIKMAQNITGQLLGWVILPNHYHFIINIDNFDLLSRGLGLLHGRTSRKWNQEEGLTNRRRVWYKFYDRAIRNERHFYASLNYIHSNPLKHKVVDDVYQWPWSSFFVYQDTLGVEWLREKWKVFKPEENFGEGWDEY